MLRRPQDDCPICAAPDRVQAAFWYLLQQTKGDFQVLSEEVTKRGMNLTKNEVSRHYSYHRPLQPAPQGYLRREQAREKIDKLRPRPQQIISLVGRVPGLTATQIAELFFWNGEEAKWASAQNAAYRQLQGLLYSDFLYRYYPAITENPRGKDRRDQVSLYYLGRDGVPLLEDLSIEMTRKDWIGSSEELAEDFRLLSQHRDLKPLAVLGKRLISDKGVPYNVGGRLINYNFNPDHWIAGRHLKFSGRDPMKGQFRFQAQQMGALTVSQGNSDLLVPFFIEYDSGIKTPEKMAEQLINYASLMRSGVLFRRWPELTEFPPILIISRDHERALRVQEASKRATGDLPVAVICDETTFNEHALTASCWKSAWNPDPQSESFPLAAILLRFASLNEPLDADKPLNLFNQPE
jgi:hypothetical protein